MWYIGSKTECKVLDGRIYDRNGRVYCTSSFDEDLRKEFLDDNMVLDVLEDHISRDILLEREEYYQRLYGVPDNPLTYNKRLAFTNLKVIDKNYLNDVGNIYGQTIKEIANNNSVVSRKDNKARSMGFPDYGTMYYEILKEKEDNNLTYKHFDDKYEQNSFFKRALRNIDSSEFETTVNLRAIKEHIVMGATFLKACEIEDIKDYVARFYFGDTFDSIFDLEERLATINGFSCRLELDNFIMREYLAGLPVTSIEKKLDNISNSTIQRTIERIVRERLKISDFE